MAFEGAEKFSEIYITFLDYYDPEQLNCGEFRPRLTFSCNDPHSIIGWVLIMTVRWPFVWLDEVNILLKKVDRISFCMAVYTMELHPAVKTSYDDHTLLE